MTRTGWLAFVVLAALAAVVGGAWRMVQRDRGELVERFSAERQRQVAESARAIGAELDEVGRAMRVMGGLLQRSKVGELPERELATLLAASSQYRVLAIYDGRGALLRRLGALDADGALDPQLVTAAIEGAARDALRREDDGPSETVAPAEALEAAGIRGYPVSVPGGHGWSRIFVAVFPRPAPGAPAGSADSAGSGSSLGPASAGAPAAAEAGASAAVERDRVVIAALLDMPRLLDRLHLLAGDGATRSFLIGAPGEPTAASDPDGARALGEADDHPATRPDLAALLGRMRAGGQGNATIRESDARALGLDSAPAIASWATIHGLGAAGWSLGTVASTAALRDHDRALVRRLTLAAGAVALLLLGFGAWLLVASRRALLLRERLRHADQLAHLHEKTEKILDHVPTAVLVLSDDGRVTAANRAARDRLPEGALGNPLAGAFPEAPEAVVARLLALVTSARAADRVRSLHGERLSLFGEEGQFSVHAVPLEPRFPEARALLVVDDVSEVRSLASQLLRAEKLATIGVLSAGIAHEIGTPLGVVRGRAEYILGKLGPGHAQSPGLAVIIEQIDRVSRTILQLLDFARVKPAAVQQVEVAPVIRAVVELLGFEAERRKVSLSLETSPDPSPDPSGGPALLAVLADPDQLQQALLNLTINAIDACAEGGHVVLGARPHVPAGSSAQDAGWPRVRIEVTDDGCGIPAELRLQVFDPFFTTKKRGQGTGLGLTMAAEIARNHGAEIEVESEAGHGTRMIVLWPTRAATQQAGDAAATSSARETREAREVHEVDEANEANEANEVRHGAA